MSKKKQKPKRSRAAAKRYGVPADLDRLIRLIPGYDPYRDAGKGKGACRFDGRAARLALEFFPECLTHVKGELGGKPLELQDWQKAIVANLWGWRRADGTRRYRVALIYVAKKNGKTTFAAGLALLMLATDNEPGAEIYSAGAAKDQAALAWQQAAVMVQREAELRRRLRVYGAKGGSVMRSITYEAQQSSYKVISPDVLTGDGFNPHGAIVDELHRQKTRDFVDLLETSTAARREPLVIHITTADYQRPSICNEKYDYACKVRDGIIRDPEFLPVVYEAGKDDDITSPATWRKANPNLGVSVTEEFLGKQAEKARYSPAYENTFRRLHLNVITEQATRWLSIEKWDECAGDLDPSGLAEAMKGRECYAGLDVSNTTDISALVLVFPEETGYNLLAYFWVPREGAVERERRDRVPYITWARQGFIELTEGNVIDYRYIRKRVNELSKSFTILEIPYDPWNATQLATQLGEEDGFKMIEFRQGTISMNEPTKEVERLVVSGGLLHGGNPVLRWMASNIAVKTDASENMRPDKEHSFEKIDGIVATIMGVARAMLRGEGRSVYDERGLLTV